MPENRPSSPEAGFSEREFYRREFQGRTLAVTLGSEAGTDIGRLAPVLEDLRGGGARVVVISPDPADLARWLGEEPLAASAPGLEGAVWRAVSATGRAGIHAPAERFGPHCRAVALRLGVFVPPMRLTICPSFPSTRQDSTGPRSPAGRSIWATRWTRWCRSTDCRAASR